MRGATLFSGGGGVEARLKDRVNFVHAVEFDPAIAAVYARNIGPHITVADVRAVDYATWGALNYLHASPVCKNASRAKTDGAETDTDVETALAVVRCLEATQPGVFTLENVWGYRTFEAFRRICQALDRNGYMWHFEHLNSADFGVPQTRRRLILRASRGLLPTLPEAVPWVGWYAAIEDLLPTLPEARFADWQLARLPEEIKGAGIMVGKQYDGPNTNADRLVQHSHPHEPAFSIVASGGGDMRAFIVSNAATMDTRGATEPMVTVTATTHSKAAMPRAWLVESKNANQQYGDGMRADHEPSHMPKAWLSAGRVVKMTPRALARFQSLPDSYALPEKASLACTIIGNMVPSLMMERIVCQML